MSDINEAVLDELFRTARSHHWFTRQPVEQSTLEAVYDLMKWGPTSMNCCPARIHFCISQQARDRLSALSMDGNKEKIASAPVAAIFANDAAFYDRLPALFPPVPTAREMFANNQTSAQATAMRNGSLQGGYFIIAARALGLGVGPISGFNNAAVDAEFFAGTTLKSNFLCVLGYPDHSRTLPRQARLAFKDACRIL